MQETVIEIIAIIFIVVMLLPYTNLMKLSSIADDLEKLRQIKTCENNREDLERLIKSLDECQKSLHKIEALLEKQEKEQIPAKARW